MRKLTPLLITIALIFSSFTSIARADDAAAKQAAIFLDTVDMESVLNASVSQTLDLYIQQQPSLKPYKATMLEFFAKYMSYESLKPDLIAMYTEAFSAAELQEINAFYQTDTGRKTIEKMPELMAKGTELGVKRVQDNLDELQAMIKAEADRLTESQGQQ